MSRRETSGPVVVITGGAGFLGRALVFELSKADALLRPGEIRVLDTRPEPADGDGIAYLRGDVREPGDIARAFAGADLVFHLAALIDWGQHPEELVRAVNVGGTRNVIEACRSAGVRGLVATSSLDVVYPGQAVHDADESTPYPSCFPTEYCASKAAAERAVLAADGSPLSTARQDACGELRTIVVRPCSIWGEGDPYHVQAFLDLARRGPVVRIGRRPAPSQTVYVRNVAHALALAGKALLEGRAEAAGQVYFVTDFPARGMFDHLAPIVRAAGGFVLPQALALPHAPVRALSRLLCVAARWLRPVYPFTPVLTPFSVDYLCQEFTVRSDKASRLLGYEPIYTEEDAYERTIAGAKDQAGRRPRGRTRA